MDGQQKNNPFLLLFVQHTQCFACQACHGGFRLHSLVYANAPMLWRHSENLLAILTTNISREPYGHTNDSKESRIWHVPLLTWTRHGRTETLTRVFVRSPTLRSIKPSPSSSTRIAISISPSRTVPRGRTSTSPSCDFSPHEGIWPWLSTARCTRNIPSVASFEEGGAWRLFREEIVGFIEHCKVIGGRWRVGGIGV